MDLNSRVWNQASTLVLTGLTTLMMTLTIFFAYNSSAEHPLTHKLIFANPSTNILVLNVLSQLAIFCLSELTTWVFAAVRWSFASSLSGIPAFTFLVLSRATNPLGVLALLLGRNDPGFSRDSHRFWGGQRYFLSGQLLIEKDIFPHSTRCAGSSFAFGCFIHIYISSGVYLLHRASWPCPTEYLNHRHRKLQLDGNSRVLVVLPCAPHRRQESQTRCPTRVYRSLLQFLLHSWVNVVHCPRSNSKSRDRK